MEGGGNCVCVWGEADQHITLNKLMSQCQFATERHNYPETSVEVRRITSIPVELGFSSWESVDLCESWKESQASLRNLIQESEKSAE